MYNVHHFKKCEDDQNETVWEMNAFYTETCFTELLILLHIFFQKMKKKINTLK